MGERRCCKVSRVVATYDLLDPQHDSVDDGLLARWRGEGSHASQGYRSLAAWFNKRVLRTVYESHGRKTVGNRIDADYEALDGGDELLRRDVEADIEADGIAVAELTSNFVSYGAIRTHLTACLDAEKETRESETEWHLDTVEMARAFATTKAETTLQSLATAGTVAGAEAARVDVTVTLQCGECPTTVPFELAYERGYVCGTHHTDSVASPEGER